jgi:glutaredoxin
MKVMKNITKFLIPIAIVIAAVIIVGGLYYSNKEEVPGALSFEEAAQKAIDYINSVALQGQATASLLEIIKESGLYKIRLQIEDQEYESYVTKDGKLLFPQGTDISEEIPEISALGETGFPKADIPQVQLFVMSFCPYGNQAEELMRPAAELLKDKASIKLHYVIYSNYKGGGPDYCLDEESKYCSLHGIQELNQGVRELCVQKYQKDKFWDFVKEINNSCDYKNVDSCWEGIAKKVGIDVAQIKTCQKDEALRILAQELELNKKYGITGSPQLIINEAEYQGSRSSEAYKQGICSAFNSLPEECSQTLGSEAGSVSGECE